MAKAGYAGVDVGLSGWYVELEPDGKGVIAAHRVPVLPGGSTYDLKGFWESMSGLTPRPVVCFVEAQRVFPKQGAVSGFTLGYGLALWEMSLTAAGIPYQKVDPQKWRKALGLPTTTPQRRKKGEAKEEPKARNARLAKAKKERKQKAFNLAQGLFPGMDLTRPGRGSSRVPDYDLADAILVAEYGRRTMRGGIREGGA